MAVGECDLNGGGRGVIWRLSTLRLWHIYVCNEALTKLDLTIESTIMGLDGVPPTL